MNFDLRGGVFLSVPVAHRQNVIKGVNAQMNYDSWGGVFLSATTASAQTIIKSV